MGTSYRAGGGRPRKVGTVGSEGEREGPQQIEPQGRFSGDGRED